MSKRKRKVKLPCDRNGTPIHVGDWLMFDDGPFHVDMLGFVGDGYGWYAENADGVDADNLGGGVILAYPKEGK